MDKINGNNTQIFSESWKMYAEGRAKSEPTYEEISKYLADRGYSALTIDIWYDTFQSDWCWNCDIKIL